MPELQAHLFISGRVQGVFYRAFIRDTAAGLGLNGWVRNLSDGRVEVVLSGDRPSIETAIAECRKGPPGAFVHDVKVSWEPRTKGLAGFEIRYGYAPSGRQG
jgi:acylphosphatase